MVRREACGIALSFLVVAVLTAEVRIASVGAGFEAVVLLLVILLVDVTEAREVPVVVPGFLATVECI